MTQSNLVDLKEIRRLIDEIGAGAADAITDIVDSLESDAERSVKEMRAAIVRGDAKALSQAAHRLKGSSATLGVVGMAAICQELEIAGANNEMVAAAALIEQLDGISDESFKALRAVSF